MIKSSIHTFYSKGITNPKEVFTYDGLCLFALSVLKARQHFKRMYFFGDVLSSSIINNELGLPFDFISTELQFFLPKPLAKFWSLSKMKASTMVYEPFVHIDNDVILHKPLPSSILDAEVLGQNLYSDDIKDIVSDLPYIRENIANNIDANRFYNGGIFGGSNLIAFREAWDDAFFTATNQANRNKLFPDVGQKFDRYNQFFEEIILGITYKRLSLSASDLFPSSPTEEEAVSLGYTHLAGNMKNLPIWQGKVRKRLAAEYPNYMRKVEGITAKYSLFKNSI